MQIREGERYRLRCGYETGEMVFIRINSFGQEILGATIIIDRQVAPGSANPKGLWQWTSDGLYICDAPGNPHEAIALIPRPKFARRKSSL